MLCNLDLGLAQILPMLDEETGAEPKIVKASLADPFLLLIRDDASILVARCDDDNDLEEIERDDEIILKMKWTTGCLYKDTTGAFKNLHRKSDLNGTLQVYMFLLNAEGTLYVSVCKLKQALFIDVNSDIWVAASWKAHLRGRRPFFRASNCVASIHSASICC